MNTHRVIPRAQIKVVKTSRSGPAEVIVQDQASDQGSFTITGIKSGYYRVYVEAEGYVARDWTTLNNRSGHTCLDADILLCHAASLKGQVVDQAGQPVAGVTVTTREIMEMTLRTEHAHAGTQ